MREGATNVRQEAGVSATEEEGSEGRLEVRKGDCLRPALAPCAECRYVFGGAEPGRRSLAGLESGVAGRCARRKQMQNQERVAGKPASDLIDMRIDELGDWRGKVLAQVRALVHKADPGIVEEWMWRGTPAWCHDGIVCTGETYKQAVKLTFARGAALKDPKRLFNASLEGSTRRAIDIHEGEKVDTAALSALVRQAVALNASSRKKR